LSHPATSPLMSAPVALALAATQFARQPAREIALRF
jgi:hypothetical protein